MGKNRNRNKRRNNSLAGEKKKTLDVQVSISSSDVQCCNNSQSKNIKELSISVQSSVKFQANVKPSNVQKYNSVSDSNISGWKSVQNFKGTQSKKNSKFISKSFDEPRCKESPIDDYEYNLNEWKLCYDYDFNAITSNENLQPLKICDLPSKNCYNASINKYKSCNNSQSKNIKELSISVKPSIKDQEDVKPSNVQKYNSVSDSNTSGWKSVQNLKGTSNQKNRNFVSKSFEEPKCKESPVDGSDFDATTSNEKLQPFKKIRYVSSKITFPSTSNDESFRSYVNYQNKTSSASMVDSKGARPKANTQRLGNETSTNKYNLKYGIKDSKGFEQHIYGSVKKYESQWDEFHKLYLTWRDERQNTISKLQELAKEVHTDQKMYNQTNVVFKSLNMGSRDLKDTNPSPSPDFFASLAAFVTDAASSITSAAQAFNIDSYTDMFKEIMGHDAKVTKPLYSARSQCLEQYRDVEEVVCRFHSNTFSSTVGNISDTLKVEDLWIDIKNSHGENNTREIINSLDTFFGINSSTEVMGKVYDSIQDYTNSNPAALEAFKSAGKALYGVYDTWGRDHKQYRSSLAGNMSIISNRMILYQDKRELSELISVANNDEMTQAKLESEIADAISSLLSEMKEISIFLKKQ